MTFKEKLATFAENLKEKKTTYTGIIGLVITLAAMVLPKVFVNVEPGEISQWAMSGYDLLFAGVGFVSSLLLLISRMFPKK